MERERLPAGFSNVARRRRTHPADQGRQEKVASCVYFTLYSKNGPWDKHVLRCETLEEARSKRESFQATYCKGGRQAAIYGVDKNGLTHFVE